MLVCVTESDSDQWKGRVPETAHLLTSDSDVGSRVWAVGQWGSSLVEVPWMAVVV